MHSIITAVFCMVNFRCAAMLKIEFSISLFCNLRKIIPCGFCKSIFSLYVMSVLKIRWRFLVLSVHCWSKC